MVRFSSEKDRTDTKAKAAPTIAEWFDRFWAAYPNKKSKGAAKKSWEKIKPDDDLAWQIIMAIDGQKRWRQRERSTGGFLAPWKFPATWLNQMCWLDEIPSAQEAKEKRKNGRQCEDCALDANVYIGEKGYCAQHYCKRFTKYKEDMNAAARKSGMRKRKDETLSDWYQRCQQWCLDNPEKVQLKTFGP